MADFKAALTKGLDANADAAAKKAEIHSVVKDVSDQIAEATGGISELEIRERVKDVVRHISSRIAIAMGLEEKQAEQVPFLQLTAVRRQPPPSAAKLGEIEIDDAGYPVTVTSGKAISEVAWDRESLEKAFAALLEHPNTGGEIQALLNLKSPADGGAGQAK
jgi:hypothetical protein